MAAKSQHPPISSRDANMNALAHPDTYSSFGYLAHASRNNHSSNMKRQKDGQIKAPPGLPNMNYRDSKKRNDSPPRNQMPVLKPEFEDFDRAPSPDGGGYGKDRIQNDLLEEICSDIGIRDPTDFDIFDFDTTTDQYIISQTKLPEDLECLDQTIPFGQLGQIQEHMGDQVEVGGRPRPVPHIVHASGSNQDSHHKDGFQHAPLTDEVKQEVMMARKSSATSDCLASPTISSTCSGSAPVTTSGCPRPASIGSSVDSPLVNSTGGPYSVESNHGHAVKTEVFDNKPKEVCSTGASNNMAARRSSACDSPAPSPARSLRGPPSVGPPSATISDKPDVSSTTPGAPRSEEDCVVLASTPSKRSGPYSIANPPRTPQSNTHSMTGTSFSAGTPCKATASCGSGSTDKPNLDPMTKDKVFRYLEQGPPSHGMTTAVDQTSGTGSASSSPPQHATKRARIISSGGDLLAEMRQRYAFTKGADMYAPSQHPTLEGVPPVQKSKVTPQVYEAPGNNTNKGWTPQSSQLQNCDFQFSEASQVDFVGQRRTPQATMSSCGRPPGAGVAAVENTNYMANHEQDPTANSYTSSMAGGVSSMGTGQQYYSNNRSYSVPDRNDSSQQQQQAHYGESGSQQPAQASMYGSCPNLNQDSAGQSGYSRYPTSDRVPIPQPRPQGLAAGPGVVYGGPQTMGPGQAPNQAYGSHIYQTPATSPVTTPQFPTQAQQGGYPMASPASCSVSAPNTPVKQGPRSAMYGSQQVPQPQQQQQWNNANSNNNQMGPPVSYSGMPGNQPLRNGRVTPNQPIPNQYDHMAHQHQNMGSATGMNNMQMQNMNMQMQPPQSPMGMRSSGLPQYPGQQGPHQGGEMNPMAPRSDQCMMPGGQTSGMQPGPNISQGYTPSTTDTSIPISQHGFMQQIISDRSSCFRSHPLFPLLRDLIIADMNFHTPSFPFALIANLPVDFDRLLQNYLQRNPPAASQMCQEDAVMGVIMDALKFAHGALIEKIQSRKQKEGYKEPDKPINAIEDFCERFDRAVKNTMTKNPYEAGFPDEAYMGGDTSTAPGPITGPNPGMMGQPCGPGMGSQPNMVNTAACMPPPQQLPPGHSHHPLHNSHSQSYQDLTMGNHGQSYHDMGGMGRVPPYHSQYSHMAERRSSSLPPSPRKPPYGRLMCADSSSESHLHHPPVDKAHHSTTGTTSTTTTSKSKVLPKEAVAYMMDWLRAHQDNPYPNDDEKEMLIQKTKLTINQINYWFTNARRRILPKWALQRYMEQQEKQKKEEQQSQQNYSVQPVVGAKH